MIWRIWSAGDTPSPMPYPYPRPYVFVGKMPARAPNKRSQ